MSQWRAINEKPKYTMFKQIKCVAYNSQGNHTDQLHCATDWQMAVRRGNVIRIILRQF